MSAFDRHPFRDLYKAAADNQPVRILGGRRVPLSAQNRRVRFSVDLAIARRREAERQQAERLRKLSAPEADRG